MPENNEQGLSIIDKSIDVFKSGSGILLNHQTRATKAAAVARDILIKWEEANALTDPDLKKKALEEIDARSNKFLANSTGAVKEMSEARKAITQLMDEVKSMFTSEENKINPEKSADAQKIQQYRNNYAKWIIAEQERIRREAEAKAAKEKELTVLQTGWKSYITNFLNDHLANKKLKMNSAFNGITLATFEEMKGKLIDMNVKFSTAVFQQLVLPDIRTVYHSTEEYEQHKFDAKDMYDYDLFSSQWESEISSLKSSLIARLNSKKEELEETERQRLEAEENERLRQENLKKIKDKEARDRAEAAAAAQRDAEQKELQRKEQERIDRENEEKAKLEEEARQRKKDAEEAEARESAAREAATLFDQVQAVAETGTAPTARKSFKVTVLHSAGWVEIFTYWYQKEGIKLGVDDFEKKTMKQMKSYVEKCAKDGEMIESKFLKYEEDLKVVNVKDK